MKKNIISSAWIGLTLLIVLITGCQTNQMPLPGQDKSLVTRIAFFSDRDAKAQIFWMSLDGQDVSPISFNIPSNLTINSLTWSTSAQKWAFSGSINGSADIYVASADGKTVQNITNSPNYFEDDPAFSPDGKQIAYTLTQVSKNTAVVTSLIDGSKVNWVSKMPLVEISPVWMRDNKNLIIVSSKEGSPNIFKVGADGTGLINLSQGKGLDQDISLSENNAMVVFISDREGGRKIFGFDFKQNKVVQLTTTELGACSSPKISADGTKIVFRSDKDGGTDLYVMNILDQSITRVTNTPDSVKWTFNWTPDGQKIIFAADNKGQLDIFTTDFEGKQTINISNNQANDYNPILVFVRQ